MQNIQKNHQTMMDFDAARALIADEFDATDKLILKSLSSEVVLINQIGHYIVGNGGKRLRPMIVLLAARALGYEGNQHINLAAIIEFIHTATLLHDDVVDGSDMRRNQETANAVWGNAVSVLVGDFLYSRAFEMMVSVKEMSVMDVLSTATNRIAEGEVLQLLNCNDPDTDEARYKEVIDRKTATLFEAGTRLGGIISKAEPEQIEALASYGHHLGMAFQMIDDALDYGSSEVDIGKNLGDDLAEGKPTLPLIRVLEIGSDTQKSLIKDVIENGNTERTEEVMAAIAATDSIKYTSQLAMNAAESAKNALQHIPPSHYRDALSALADFAVSRAL